MKLARLTLVIAVILLGSAIACSAGHYSLAQWRCMGTDESHGIAAMAVHVSDENGNPMSGVSVYFQGVLNTGSVTTDYRGYAEYGFQFAGSPCHIYCSDLWGSTSDVTPDFYNHDSHRFYEAVFMFRSSASNPGSFDTTWDGDLTLPSHAPRTRSLTMSTPDPLDFAGDTRDLSPNNVWEFGQTFTATADRVVAMRAHLTKGWLTRFRWTGQIFEIGPDGPPMGPKKILPNEYIEGDNKYLLRYALDECALKPGTKYYVSFATADGTEVNAYECLNDVYPGGCLYENHTPTYNMDLQAWVCGMNSGNTNVGTVQGTVTDEDGQPIAQAAIVLDPGGKKITTGNVGTYKCYNVEPGTYAMTASAPGFQSVTVTGRTVSVGGTLTTDFTLPKAAGPVNIVSVTGATIDPGDVDVPVSMTVESTGGDLFVNSAHLTFWQGAVDVSSHFTVTPSGSNPTVIRGGDSEVFNFLVDCSLGTPTGSYTVQGVLDADANLVENGSFEADASYGATEGPTGWVFYSSDPPSVARLSYQQNQLYRMPGGEMPRDVTKGTLRWIGAWSGTAENKKQGFKLYVPQAGSATAAHKLRFDIRCGDHKMVVATGTPDVANWEYYFTPGTYYQIDAWVRASDGRFQVDITPLDGQGSSTQCTGTAGYDDSDTPRIEWGRMYYSGEDEMSCREFHYWLEGPSASEVHWLAVNGILPTSAGWAVSGGGTGAPYEQMVPGAPWSPAAHCHANTTDVKEGAQSLDMWFSPSGTNRYMYINSGNGVSLPRVDVEPCTTYNISCWYKTQDYGSGQYDYLRLVWEEYNSGGSSYFQQGVDPQIHENSPEPLTGGGWRQATYTFTTSQWADSCRLELQMRKASTERVAVQLTFDDVRVMGPNSYTDEDADTPGTLVVQGAVPVDSIADAKNQPDGTQIALTGVAVTGYPVDDANRFYIEDLNRVSGIAVDKTGGSGSLDVVEGDLIDITGTLDTVNGERVLTLPNVTSKTSGTAPADLGLTNRYLGGVADGYTPGVEDGLGVNNVGLLVTVWGTITSSGTGYFYIDDGSGVTDGVGTGLKVISGSITQQPGATYATVTGFSSVEESGGKYYRVVRPRAGSDIAWQ